MGYREGERTYPRTEQIRGMEVKRKSGKWIILSKEIIHLMNLRV